LCFWRTPPRSGRPADAPVETLDDAGLFEAHKHLAHGGWPAGGCEVGEGRVRGDGFDEGGSHPPPIRLQRFKHGPLARISTRLDHLRPFRVPAITSRRPLRFGFGLAFGGDARLGVALQVPVPRVEPARDKRAHLDAGIERGRRHRGDVVERRQVGRDQLRR
jgi:hypothetical protein